MESCREATKLSRFLGMKVFPVAFYDYCVLDMALYWCDITFLLPLFLCENTPSDIRHVCGEAAAVVYKSFPLGFLAFYFYFEFRSYQGFYWCNKKQKAPSGTSWNRAVKQFSTVWRVFFRQVVDRLPGLYKSCSSDTPRR